LPADLWQSRQLHLLPIHVDRSMPIISVRPCGPMHHEPLLRRRWPPQTSRVLAVNKLRLSRILPSLRGAKATKQSRAKERLLTRPWIASLRSQ
jgi:hypothetical protein